MDKAGEQSAAEPKRAVAGRAAGNLAFLMSVIRCGESLSPDEEQGVRNLIEELNRAEASTAEQSPEPRLGVCDFGDYSRQSPHKRDEHCVNWRESGSVGESPLIHWSLVADDLSPMCWEEDHHADEGQFLIETDISKVMCAACKAHYRTLNDLKLAESACEYCMGIAEGGVIPEQRSEAMQTVLDGGHFKGCAEYTERVGESPAPATPHELVTCDLYQHKVVERNGDLTRLPHEQTSWCVNPERVAAPPEPAADNLATALRELHSIDEALARRPALADLKDRYSKVYRACEMAGRADALQEKLSTLEQALRTALIPLAALVMSGECTADASALTDEMKVSILTAHDAILELRVSGESRQ